jgi:hypothetical protein
MTFIKRITVLVIATLFMSGCATQLDKQVDIYSAQLEEDRLYVKGTFNWWGVNEAFRFTSLAGKSNSWFVDVDLIDDGNLYDFKLADENWSPSQTCGAYSTKEVLQIKQATKLFCDSASQNFQFSPIGNGKYRLIISKNSQSIYTLSITKI